MSYNRIAKPKMYLDHIAYNLTNGWKAIGDHTLTGSPSSGSFEDLFDLRPSNYVTWAAATEPVTIIIDTGFANSVAAEANFLAILGHNFEEAGARFKLSHDDDSNFGSEEVITVSGYTDVVNSPLTDTSYSTPGNNGWSLISWSENSTNNRYYRLKIDKSGASSFSSDLKIGAIMLGEAVSWPHSADLNAKFGVEYGGTEILESAGGNTYAVASHLGSPGWAKTNPWVIAPSSSENQTYNLSRHYGRRNYDLNFSFISDSDFFPSNMNVAHGGMIDGSDLYTQFFNKVMGSQLPFLFSIDGSTNESNAGATVEGDHGLYRLANNGFTAKQVAPNTWNTSLNLVEHW